MTEQLYVTKPGGITVPLAKGGSVNVEYGEEVPEGITDVAKRYIREHAAPRDAGEAGQDAIRAAHDRSALADGGQPQQASSPVPSNYADLSEDAAARLVESLSAYPSSQALILVHEGLHHGGRQKVIDAATDAARIDATMRLQGMFPEEFAEAVAEIEDERDGEEGGGDQLPPLTPEQIAQMGIVPPPPDPGRPVVQNDGLEWDEDQWTHAQLDEYVARHELPDVPQAKGNSKADRVAAIKQYEGHERPATPPSTE